MSTLEAQDRQEKTVFGIIKSYYPDLTEKEFDVLWIITYTMWDFHWDFAHYPEIVARVLHLPVGEEEIHEEPSIFTSEEELHSIIAGLVAKGVLEDKLVEFLYGSDDNRHVRNDRVLSFVRNGLYKEMQKKRLELGCEY